MEPPQAKMRLFLGSFVVVRVEPLMITISLGNKVYIHVHPGDFPHTVEEGDTLPLFTEVPYAIT